MRLPAVIALCALYFGCGLIAASAHIEGKSAEGTIAPACAPLFNGGSDG